MLSRTSGRDEICANRLADHCGGGNAYGVTRLGFSIIVVGIVLLTSRAVGLVDIEAADILSVLAIVLGALAVAVDGERTPRAH